MLPGSPAKTLCFRGGGSSSVFSSDSMGGISTKVSSVVSHLSLRILGNGKRYNFLRGGAGGSFGLRSPLH